MERSLLLFEEGITSKATLGLYRFGLEKFRTYYKIKNADAILTIEHKQLQIMVEDYVMNLKKTVSPNTVPTYMKGVEHFFIMNDVNLNWKKIHRLYPAKVKLGGGNAYTTEDVQRMLQLVKNKKIIALIHFLASTGARIGALSELKLKHVADLTEGCKTVKLHEGEKEEYNVFLTPEASKTLDSYIQQRKMDGEYITGDSPLFRSKYVVGSLKAKPSTTGALKNLIRNIVNKSVSREKVGRRYNKAMDHAFRKRFNTILKNNDHCNRSLTEKLMSHEVKAIPLDSTYHDPNLDVLFNEFKKHIYELTINDSERLIMKNQQLEAEKNQQESKNEEVRNLKEKFELDHQFLQVFAHTLLGAGIKLLKPNGEPYEIDNEVVKQAISNYVEEKQD